MLTNTTTWEKAARKRITYLKALKNDSFNPFHEGYFKNIFLFLCYFKDIKWEKFYKGVVNDEAVVSSNNDDDSSSDDYDEVFVSTMIEKNKKDVLPLIKNEKKTQNNKNSQIFEVNETEN
jgi:hypothetical protein